MIHREQCGGVTCMALLYHYGTAGLGAAGECFYTEGMLQVIHTITWHLEPWQADTHRLQPCLYVCACGCEHITVGCKVENEQQQHKWRRNEGPNLFSRKTNILLRLENQSFHSQKVLHQPFRKNANNNQNAWAGRIKNFKEG